MDVESEVLDIGLTFSKTLDHCSVRFVGQGLVKLRTRWEEEYKAWQARSLAGKRYAYVWADGVYFNVRLESPGNIRQCILVLMGATIESKKELRAVADGYRESDQSWLELLLDLRSRGLVDDPELATGDGSLGFWKALPKVYAKTRRQRCWVHKTANTLNKMPSSIQAKGKSMLHDIWIAAGTGIQAIWSEQDHSHRNNPAHRQRKPL